MVDDKEKSGEDAYSIFPDLMGGKAEQEQSVAAQTVADLPTPPMAAPAVPVKRTPPPEPPDLSWLVSGEFKAGILEADVPTALLLTDGEARKAAEDAFGVLGYQVVDADSEEQAIMKINGGTISAVILHQDFVGGEFSGSVFHDFMKSLGMAVRRPIFYILIGKQFHTLYDLEALSESANLVVNSDDVKYLNTIIRKGLKDYERLFGPLAAADARLKLTG